MAVHAPQRGAERWTVGPHRVLGAVSEQGSEHSAQLFAHSLGRHAPVSLDPGEIPVAGMEERTVGDDDADVEGGGLHAVLATDQGVHEGVCLDRLVAATVTGGAESLGLMREALPDQRRVERAHVGGDGGHPVLTAAHGDVAFPPGLLVAPLLPVRIRGRDDGGGGVIPGLGSGPVERRETAGELSICLETLLGRERGEGAGGGVGDGAGDLRGGQRREHLGHVRDQPPLGGEGVSRRRGRLPDQHRDLSRRFARGLAQELARRRDLALFVGGVGARLGLLLEGERVRKSGDRPRLEGIHGAAQLVDHAHHLPIPAREGGIGGEQLLRVQRELPQREGAVPHHLGERLRALSAHGIDQCPVGITGCRVESLRIDEHMTMIHRTTDK